jgi:hypothetical protein
MTFVPTLDTTQIRLGNINKTGDGIDPVVSLKLDTNNVKPMYSQKARLVVAWEGSYPAELEIEPGPDCQSPNGSAIISQVMLWGKRTPTGAGRQRVTLTIALDPDGTQYALLDSTTNDASGSVGQAASMPLLINMGEEKGIYFGVYPGNKMKLRNGKTGSEIEIPLAPFMALLAGLK